MMPTTVRAVPSTSIVLPTSDGSAPKEVVHSAFEISATGAAPGTMSPACSTRPRAAPTPSAWKRLEVTVARSTRRGRSGAVRLDCPVEYAPTVWNDFCRSTNSRYSGAETQNWSNPSDGNWLEMNTSRSGSG